MEECMLIPQTFGARSSITSWHGTANGLKMPHKQDSRIFHQKNLNGIKYWITQLYQQVDFIPDLTDYSNAVSSATKRN